MTTVSGVSVHDYASALKVCEAAYKRHPASRGRIGMTRKRQEMTVLKRDEDIVFKFYRTEVVTWHKDESFTLVPYPSMSTNAFARALIPSSVIPAFTGSEMMVGVRTMPESWETQWHKGLRIYAAYSGMRMRKTDEGWAPDKPEPFTLRFLNRKRGNAALKAANYPAFEAWLKAYEAFEGQNRGWDYRNIRRSVQLLGSMEGWKELAETGVDLPAMRKRIYLDAQCYDTEEREWITRSELANVKKYGG